MASLALRRRLQKVERILEPTRCTTLRDAILAKPGTLIRFNHDAEAHIAFCLEKIRQGIPFGNPAPPSTISLRTNVHATRSPTSDPATEATEAVQATEAATGDDFVIVQLLHPLRVNDYGREMPWEQPLLRQVYHRLKHEIETGTNPDGLTHIEIVRDPMLEISNEYRKYINATYSR